MTFVNDNAGALGSISLSSTNQRPHPGALQRYGSVE